MNRENQHQRSAAEAFDDDTGKIELNKLTENGDGAVMRSCNVFRSISYANEHKQKSDADDADDADDVDFDVEMIAFHFYCPFHLLIAANNRKNPEGSTKESYRYRE